MKPLVIDLFCGLGGWSEAFIAQGYRAVGFDVERHDYGAGGYPGELVLRDVRTITGSELVATYGVPACIVASPPCQEFSYMAMPWSKAKKKRTAILSSETEKKRLTDLFNQCFRIQREVSEAAGHHVPMVVENVRGAQEWVGKARWAFGSFYLWGDVPALMPIPAKRVLKNGITHRANGETNFHGFNSERTALGGDLCEGAKVGISWSKSGPGKPGQSFQTAAVEKGEGNKSAGMNWSDQTKRGQDFTRVAGRQAMEGCKGVPHRTAGDWTNPAENGTGVKGFTTNGHPFGKNAGPRKHGSKSSARKRASAEIAKIPPALADWIARCFKPA